MINVSLSFPFPLPVLSPPPYSSSLSLPLFSPPLLSSSFPLFSPSLSFPASALLKNSTKSFQQHETRFSPSSVLPAACRDRLIWPRGDSYTPKPQCHVFHTSLGVPLCQQNLQYYLNPSAGQSMADALRAFKGTNFGQWSGTALSEGAEEPTSPNPSPHFLFHLVHPYPTWFKSYFTGLPWQYSGTPGFVLRSEPWWGLGKEPSIVPGTQVCVGRGGGVNASKARAKSLPSSPTLHRVSGSYCQNLKLLSSIDMHQGQIAYFPIAFEEFVNIFR